MKKGDRVILKNTKEIGFITYATSILEEPFYFVGTALDKFNIEERSALDLVAFNDITILDEYKEVESDVVFIGEDSEGVLVSVTIPTVDIANYFEVEEIRINEEADYQGAAQSVFDVWVNSPKAYDIEIELK